MGLNPSNFASTDLDGTEADMPTVEAVPITPPAGVEPDAASKLDPLIGRFLRSLHVLLRAVRLYQRNHPRVTESLEAVDRDLRTILVQVPALSIKIERDGLIATTRQAPGNTRPLPDLRGEL